MSDREFASAGLTKLTQSELESLDAWLNAFAQRVIQVTQNQTTTRPATPTRPNEYVVEASANDETFVINGEVFKAKTYCFGVETGDRVIFVEGSPFGACASAEFLVLRTGTVCRCWCE